MIPSKRGSAGALLLAVLSLGAGAGSAGTEAPPALTVTLLRWPYT